MTTRSRKRLQAQTKSIADSIPAAKLDDNLSSLAYRSITKLIVNQTLQGVIVEAKLAGELGISRTPLREALQRLEGQGLVNKTDRSFSVKPLDLKDVVHSLHVRELLETKAINAAAARVPLDLIAAVRKETEALWHEGTSRDELWRLDQAVHELVLDHCNNAVLADLVRAQRIAGWLARNRSGRRFSPERLRASKAEHLSILSALASRDARRAARAMQAHLGSLIRTEVELSNRSRKRGARQRFVPEFGDL